MKTEVFKETIFWIGRDRHDNFNIIDLSQPHYYWFHVNNQSSCHVIACIKDVKIEKKTLQKIIKHGALLCKINSKFKKIDNVDIVYTQVKNIQKTKIPGCVLTPYKMSHIVI
jgi:predicted ribosome quality control (RQC) complex YloA/Tae2 family protein